MSVLVSPQSQPDNVCWWSEEEGRLQDEAKARRVLTEGRQDYACLWADECRLKEEGADTHACSTCGGKFHALCTTSLASGVDDLASCGRKSCGKAASDEVAEALSSTATPTLTPEAKKRIVDKKAKAIAKLVDRGQGSGELDTAGNFVYFEDKKGDVAPARSAEKGGASDAGSHKKRLFHKLSVYGAGESTQLINLVNEEARRAEARERESETLSRVLGGDLRREIEKFKLQRDKQEASKAQERRVEDALATKSLALTIIEREEKDIIKLPFYERRNNFSSSVDI